MKKEEIDADDTASINLISCIVNAKEASTFISDTSEFEIDCSSIDSECNKVALTIASALLSNDKNNNNVFMSTCIFS